MKKRCIAFIVVCAGTLICGGLLSLGATTEALAGTFTVTMGGVTTGARAPPVLKANSNLPKNNKGTGKSSISDQASGGVLDSYQKAPGNKTGKAGPAKELSNTSRSNKK